MKIKKDILLIAMIIPLFTVYLYAEERVPKDKPGTAVFVMSTENSELVTVTTHFIEEEKDHLQLNMQIPVIGNLKNKILQTRLNRKIKKEQMCLKRTIEKDAIRNYQYATKKGYPVLPYELMTNYHVKSNNGIFSLEITIYDYRGGAHGMTTRRYYNIDTNTGKLICLEDIVDKDMLNKEIARQIEERKSQGEIFFEGDEGFNGIKENQLFYITQEGQLVIVFGLYEIAPYVAGIQEFPIPKEIITVMIENISPVLYNEIVQKK